MERILSVSNFRGLPIKSLRLEKLLQPLLSTLFFGPSIFILAKRRTYSIFRLGFVVWGNSQTIEFLKPRHWAGAEAFALIDNIYLQENL